MVHSSKTMSSLVYTHRSPSTPIHASQAPSRCWSQAFCYSLASSPNPYHPYTSGPNAQKILNEDVCHSWKHICSPAWSFTFNYWWWWSGWWQSILKQDKQNKNATNVMIPCMASFMLSSRLPHQVFGRFGFGCSGHFPELPKQPKPSKWLSTFLSKVHHSKSRFEDSESTQTALRVVFRLHLSIYNCQNAARKWILIANYSDRM